MSAVLRIEPIAARVTTRPEYINDFLDVRTRWLKANAEILREYWDENPGDESDYEQFCQAQYDLECNEVENSEVDWEVERLDELYDRSRSL